MTALPYILCLVLAQSACPLAGPVELRYDQKLKFDERSPISINPPQGSEDGDLIIRDSLNLMIMSPVRGIRGGNTKRDRLTALQLKNEETFYWQGQDGNMASFKIEMPSGNENIVNFDLIDDMIRDITCPQANAGQLKLQFLQAADFKDATDISNWVNLKQENHFLMIIGNGLCRWNQDRVVYSVEELGYDNSIETAVLTVRRTTWKESAHTYDLDIGDANLANILPLKQRMGASVFRRGFFDKVGSVVSGVTENILDAASDTAGKVVDIVSGTTGNVVDAVSGAAGRAGDIISGAAEDVVNTVAGVGNEVIDAVDSVANTNVSPDLTIPFKNDFSGKGMSFAISGVEVVAKCQNCSTTGAFNVQGRFRARNFVMQEALVTLKTSGISAEAILELSLTGNLTDKLAERSLPIFKIPPVGVSVPGIVTIGPTVSVKLGAEVSELTGGVTVSLGGTATIPASSSTLDFLKQSGTKSTGWKAKFRAEPLKADAVIEAKARPFLKPVLA
jgi:hypothetical protein